MAKIVCSLGAKHLSRKRAAWLAGIMADQNPRLMVRAWREAMAFDSRRRLGEIECPTLVIAGSNDDAVPMHHAKMLHDGIAVLSSLSSGEFLWSGSLGTSIDQASSQ